VTPQSLHPAPLTPAERTWLDAMDEDTFLGWVVDEAMREGWCVSHQRPARTAKGWRTLVQGVTGVQDLILARYGEVILAEIKTNGQSLRPDQRPWAHHAGNHGTIWRPRDADEIRRRLAKPHPALDGTRQCLALIDPTRKHTR
jgi:hypothetical protein